MRTNLKWRLAALVALFAYLVLAVIVVWWLAHNILFALVMGLTIPCLVYAAWLVATGSHGRLRKGYIVAGVGLVLFSIELVYFVHNNNAIRALLGLAALTCVYLALLSGLRKQYWARARRHGEAIGQISQFTHPFLIINPKSGNGRALKAGIPERARAMGVSVLVTQKGDDVESLARRAVAQGADVLGISGGDGSIGALAKVAIEHNLPMVVLPGGTRCHFARDIGLEPKRIADALNGFTGVERRVDVATINGRIVLNNVSFGLYADIIDNPNYRQHKREVSRRVLRDLLSGTKSTYPLRFRYKGQQFSKAVQVLVGVNRYTTLDIFEMGHRNCMDEGVLQVTAITRLTDSLFARLLTVMSIGRLRSSNALQDVYEWVTPAFTVGAPKHTIVAGVDGEREEYKTPVTIRVMPSALTVYVPAEGVRSRRKNPFDLTIVRELWQAVAHK